MRGREKLRARLDSKLSNIFEKNLGVIEVGHHQDNWIPVFIHACETRRETVVVFVARDQWIVRVHELDELTR